MVYQQTDDLDTMQEFLQRPRLLEMTQEETESLNRPITCKEIRLAIKKKKNLSCEGKTQHQMVSPVNSSKSLKNEHQVLIISSKNN